MGALPLPFDAVAHLAADGDSRWINRGGYDLLDAAPGLVTSSGGIPKAIALYGPLPKQLAQPASFASQLREMLTLRQRCGLFGARQIDVPDCDNPALLVLVHELPDELPNGGSVQVTALNFGSQPVSERVEIPAEGQVVDMRTGKTVGAVEAGQLKVMLDEYAWGAYLVDG